MGLLCAEQDVRNLKKMHVPKFWYSCAQNKTSESSRNGLSRIMGLLCAEQNVGNIKNMHVQELWDSCAQRKTSKYLKMHFQEFWDSCAQNKTSKISRMDFQKFWDSCAQNKTSELSKDGLSGILELLCSEQDVGKMLFQELWDSCAQNTASEISKTALSGVLGLLCAEHNRENLKKMHFHELFTLRDAADPGLKAIWWKSHRKKSANLRVQERSPIFWFKCLSAGGSACGSGPRSM